MGQDILLLLIIFVLIIVFLYQIAANAKRRERYLKNTWKEAWGTASEKEYDRTKYESISHYFQQLLRKGIITEPYVRGVLLRRKNMTVQSMSPFLIIFCSCCEREKSQSRM